jgi:uncharacterized protein (TIGR01244 family)
MQPGIIVTLALFFGIGAGMALAGEPVSEIRKIDVAGIKNFSEFSGSSSFGGTHVGFGGSTQPSAMSTLKDMGFATVVNLRLASEEGVDIEGNQAAALAAGINYIHLPFKPSSMSPTLMHDFLKIMGDTANQPVYVHCGSATRVSALWMINRVQQDGLDTGKATQELEAIALKPDEAKAFATAYLAAHQD